MTISPRLISDTSAPTPVESAGTLPISPRFCCACLNSDGVSVAAQFTSVGPDGRRHFWCLYHADLTTALPLGEIGATGAVEKEDR